MARGEVRGGASPNPIVLERAGRLLELAGKVSADVNGTKMVPVVSASAGSAVNQRVQEKYGQSIMGAT